MNIEFRDGELEALAQDGKYIVQYKTIYLARYTKNAGARLEKVYYSREKLPLTNRGRFHVLNFEGVNRLLGFKLLVK